MTTVRVTNPAWTGRPVGCGSMTCRYWVPLSPRPPSWLAASVRDRADHDRFD